MSWEQIQSIATNGWIVGPAAFVLWLVLALIAKKAAYRPFRKYMEHFTGHWDDIIIESTNMPLNLLILFIGLNIMERIMPLGDKLDRYLVSSIRVTLILLGIFFVDRLVRAMLLMSDRRAGTIRFSQGIIQGIVRGLIFLIGALILLDSFGVNITPLLASLGVGSLAVALALQPTLANLFAGLFISMDRSLNVGDLIELENGGRGYIEDIGWRTCKVRLRDDNLVVIPNSKLVDSIVTNIDGDDKRIRAQIRCGVHYESDLRRVREIALEVANEMVQALDEADKSFEPWMRFEEFGDSSINFTVVVRAMGYAERFVLVSEIIVRLHERFNEEGIVIPFPLRTLDLQPKHEKLLRELAGKPPAQDGKS